MPKYCIFLTERFRFDFLKHLKQLPFSVKVRYVNNDPPYIAVRCEERRIRTIYRAFKWIRRIEPQDPGPIFMADWSEEE